MRLPILREGQSVLQKALFGVIRMLAPGVPGPVLAMSFKQPFFGKHFSRILEHSMREMKHWSVAEVEVFAAFVSKQNKCHY